MAVAGGDKSEEVMLLDWTVEPTMPLNPTSSVESEPEQSEAGGPRCPNSFVETVSISYNGSRFAQSEPLLRTPPPTYPAPA